MPARKRKTRQTVALAPRKRSSRTRARGVAADETDDSQNVSQDSQGSAVSSQDEMLQDVSMDADKDIADGNQLRRSTRRLSRTSLARQNSQSQVMTENTSMDVEPSPVSRGTGSDRLASNIQDNESHHIEPEVQQQGNESTSESNQQEMEMQAETTDARQETQQDTDSRDQVDSQSEGQQEADVQAEGQHGTCDQNISNQPDNQEDIQVRSTTEMTKNEAQHISSQTNETVVVSAQVERDATTVQLETNEAEATESSRMETTESQLETREAPALNDQPLEADQFVEADQSTKSDQCETDQSTKADPCEADQSTKADQSLSASNHSPEADQALEAELGTPHKFGMQLFAGDQKDEVIPSSQITTGISQQEQLSQITTVTNQQDQTSQITTGTNQEEQIMRQPDISTDDQDDIPQSQVVSSSSSSFHRLQQLPMPCTAGMDGDWEIIDTSLPADSSQDANDSVLSGYESLPSTLPFTAYRGGREDYVHPVDEDSAVCDMESSNAQERKDDNLLQGSSGQEETPSEQQENVSDQEATSTRQQDLDSDQTISARQEMNVSDQEVPDIRHEESVSDQDETSARQPDQDAISPGQQEHVLDQDAISSGQQEHVLDQDAPSARQQQLQAEFSAQDSFVEQERSSVQKEVIRKEEDSFGQEQGSLRQEQGSLGQEQGSLGQEQSSLGQEQVSGQRGNFSSAEGLDDDMQYDLSDSQLYSMAEQHASSLLQAEGLTLNSVWGPLVSDK